MLKEPIFKEKRGGGGTSGARVNSVRSVNRFCLLNLEEGITLPTFSIVLVDKTLALRLWIRCSDLFDGTFRPMGYTNNLPSLRVDQNYLSLKYLRAYMAISCLFKLWACVRSKKPSSN